MNGCTYAAVRPGPEHARTRERFLERWNEAWPHLAFTERELDHELATREHPYDYVVVESVDGTSVAMLACEHNPWTPDAEYAFTLLAVADGWWDQGVEDELYRRACTFAGAHGFSGLRAQVLEGDERTLRFWLGHRLQPNDREFDSGLDLTTATIPDWPLPAGVELVTLAGREDLLPEVYSLMAQTIGDIPGPDTADMVSYDLWLATNIHHPCTRLELYFLALDDEGRAAGLVMMEPQLARPGYVWNGYTGVVPAWRGRGLAKALKAHAAREARDRFGFSTIVTDNAEDNAPMRAINDAMGYRRVGVRLRLGGPLPAMHPAAPDHHRRAGS